MPTRTLRVQVSACDKRELNQLLSAGIQPVRVVLRALALLRLAEGATAPQVARDLGKLTSKAVRGIAHRYTAGTLERVLFDKPRSGAAELLNASEKQRIIAMVCADPPAGQARWTIRLIAHEAVRRKLVSRVGRETIRVLLQSHDLKPWREKKCGPSPISPMNMSPVWKKCLRCMRSL